MARECGIFWVSSSIFYIFSKTVSTRNDVICNTLQDLDWARFFKCGPVSGVSLLEPDGTGIFWQLKRNDFQNAHNI